MNQIQVHIFYSGTVQGVGFRFMVQRYASRLNLNGWVKNLNDGRVEILVEGDRGDVQQLLADVESYFGDYIKHKEEDRQESTQEHSSFRIVY